MSTPLYIRKLSKRWHQNTISGKYIAAANLDATLAREKLARSQPQVGMDKDERIRRKRWDLDKD